MTELSYTKEVTYKYSYNGETYYDYHYVDNIINMRHRSINENIGDNKQNNKVTPLNIKGTGASHQAIDAVLLGERVYYTDVIGRKFVDLLFLLPDINHYVKMEYFIDRDSAESKPFTYWGVVPSVILFKDNI